VGLRCDWLDCILAVSDGLARSPLSDDWRGKGRGGDNICGMWRLLVFRFLVADENTGGCIPIGARRALRRLH
jgi:hypothetical protein